MSSEIINKHRYKKVARNKLNKKTKQKYKTERLQLQDIDKKKTIKKTKKIKKTSDNNVLKIGACIVAILLIGFLSKIIIKKVNNVSTNVFYNKESNTNLQKDYNLKIGISKLDITDQDKSKNIVLSELNKIFSTRLLDIKEDYTIEYMAAEKIEKLTDTQYLITLNPVYNLLVSDVKNNIDKIKSLGKANIYYENVENISAVEETDNKSFKITLNHKDPYFLYKLSFPMTPNDNKNMGYIIGNKDSSSITYVRNKSNYSLSSISIQNFEDTDSMIDQFRDGKIDMFTASSDSIMQQIGKHEYNVKKYRDGEAIFLLGNPNSSLFKRKEVRQAIAYSLNRDEIIKKVNNNFMEVIDIPYVYSKVSYKFDTYAAENVLVLNGWKKTGGVYNKNENYQYKKIELNMLVNQDDKLKVQIADIIKEMVEQVGIRLNIIKLSEKDIQKRVNSNDYDIILSTVYMNDSPNISYLYSYVNVNEVVDFAINKVEQSDNTNITENIINLKEVISNEVACIGIMARNTNVVTQKYINGFDNLNYMKIFSNINNIGRNIE